jgi:RimJ/RimL family protein N-acetyltransferase
MKNTELLSVREIQLQDIPALVDYWMNADAATLAAMGADINKMPPREEWERMLTEQAKTPIKKRKSYCIIWEIGGEAVGHSNVNNIVFGQEATMHLHLWKADKRQKGAGTRLVKMTLPYFFENLELQTLYCEPYALNPAPNRVLENVGFIFVKKHTTTPGSITFEQEVNRWELTVERYREIR